MKPKFHEIERYRYNPPGYPNAKGMRQGAFLIPFNGVVLRCIASDGSDWHACGLSGQPWEHVSVSLPDRCPTWQEMAFIKSVFWNSEETVVQFHVPDGEHINHHEHCLHLWRPVRSPVLRPPGICVA